MGQRSLTTLHPERASLVVTVISDNDFSATVVSYQKKGSGSHFVPFSLHVILSIVIYDRAEGRVCLPFSLLVFSPLLFQYPWPRRPLVTSHTRSPLGRTPGFTLTPVIFVIPGDFSFVLLCTHRAPGSSRPASFLEETHFTLFLLGRHRFRSTHGGLVPRIVPNAIGTPTTSVLKNPSTAFSCRKVVWILTLYLSPQLWTWRTLLRQLQPQHFEPTRPPLFEF